MSDSVGSVSVEVVPDARGWSEKLRAQIRDTTAKVNVNADTGEAAAQIDEVARDRKATIEVSADKSQLSGAATSLDGMVKNVSLLPALFIAAGAAAIPLAATIGGLAAALAAPLAIAGGGAGLFAIVGAAAVKQTQTQLKQVDQLKKSVDSAKTSLESAQRSAGKNASTSASVANAQDRLTKATAAYKDAVGQLTPAQKKYADSLTGLKGAFSQLLAGKSGQDVLGVIASGMDLLSKTLPVIAPVLGAVSREFGSLLDELSRSAGSKGFANFIHDFAHQVGPDIDVFAHVAGNIAKGFGGLFLALDSKKLSGGVLDGLLHLSQNFANLGQGAKGSQWLKDFIDYFHKVGPQVADTAGAVAGAVGHLVRALAPLGPPVLHIIQGIADAFSSIPIPVLTALAGATVGLTAFGKLGGFKAVGALTGGIHGPGGLLSKATGVVPVFVTNKGFGGPGGSEGNWLSKLFKTGAPDAAAGAEGAAALTAPEIAAMAGLFTAGVGAQTVLTQSERHGFANYGKQTVTPPGMFGNNTGYVDKPGQQHFQFNPANHFTGQIHDATAFDALRAHAASASQTIDRIGPNAANSLAVAQHAVAALQNRIDAIHDHPFKVIAQTQAAVASLERLQSLTIRDKQFTVTELFQQRERAVGPGGGIQHHALGGLIRGAGSGSSDSIPSWLSNGEFVVNAVATSRNRALLESLNRGMYHTSQHAGQMARYMTAQGGGSGGGDVHSHVYLDGKQIAHVVRPIAASVSDDVYHANRGYEDQAAGR